MRISENEIERSLRLLSQQSLEPNARPRIDKKINQLVLGQLKEVPEVRKDKVRSLRAAIEESRYQVSCEEVARLMLGRCFADHLR